MTPIKLVVIDKPGANHLKVLDTLPASVNVVVSNQPACCGNLCKKPTSS